MTAEITEAERLTRAWNTLRDRGVTLDGSPLSTAQIEAMAAIASGDGYPVVMSAAQIFGFADLVRRLAAADYRQDGDPLRQELVDALHAVLNLMPEPTHEDGDVYLKTVRAGRLPNWAGDDLPLTESTADWVARVHPEYAPAVKAGAA